MNLEKYSERVRGFIQSAQQYALNRNHQQFTPEHILKALIDDDEGFAASLIERAGGRPRDVEVAVDAALNAQPKVEGGNEAGVIEAGQGRSRDILGQEEQHAHDGNGEDGQGKAQFHNGVPQ